MRTTQLTGQRGSNGGPKTAVDLKEQMRRAGASAQRLDITEVGPGLHERAEGLGGRRVYLVSPAGRPAASGKGLTWRFIKLSPDGLNLPAEAERRLGLATDLAEPDETAIFLSTRLADRHLGLLLAVRVSGAWLELYRWTSSWMGLGLSRLDVSQF